MGRPTEFPGNSEVHGSWTETESNWMETLNGISNMQRVRFVYSEIALEFLSFVFRFLYLNSLHFMVRLILSDELG
jgi:hypothetical protein